MAQAGVAVKLIGEDGNAFAIMGAVNKALKRAGLKAEADAFMAAAMKCKSYDALLALAMETVEVE